MPTTPRHVTSPDGTRLAVYESGEPGSPTVLAVHGYPDNHTVWDGVTARLAERFHVVTYDVRGTGASDKPGSVSGYRMPRLVADLAAVIGAVSPARPVHLLAHDWGSIQTWAALGDDALAGRVASFTSISGPDLDYSAAWLRGLARHPRAALRQLAHSYYIGLFQLPGLPEFAARHGVLDRLIALSAAGSRSRAAAADQPQRGDAERINGLALYRANMLAALARPRPLPVSVPVQVIAPDRDPYITAQLAFEAPRRWVADLTTHTVAGGHWVVSERPDVIARLTAQFVDGLSRPRAGRLGAPARAGQFAGRLVVVTGAARGIGRATALEFARHGADVVVADINDAAAKETVDDVRELGVRAWARHLDVADRAAWEDFTAALRDEHGVPDVLVNNAGIGMGGRFLDTGPDDWAKILDVNLWSVIHGSRLVAAQQIERGQGGHIVNVASAAAFAPSIALPAYATTKAAVLMLTECLRAELDREGIGVTAVCPGFVDTDISATTIQVGVDDDTAERMRESRVAAYHRRNYPPEKVARQIVRAVAARRPLAVVTPEAKVLRAMSRFAPAAGRRFARLDLDRLAAR